MADEAQDKQHLASSKRIAELRKKGQVLRSRDLTGGLVFFIMIMMLVFYSAEITSRLQANFVLTFYHISHVTENFDLVLQFLKLMATKTLILLLPIFGIAIAITLLSPFLFGGWNFTLEALHFNIEKLNPFANLSNIFSLKRSAMEVLRSAVKAAVFLIALIYFVLAHKHDLLILFNYSTKSAISNATGIIEQFVYVVACVLIFIVILDVIYHFYEYQERTKMSGEELKEEYKETEGNPEVKKKLRSAQHALLKQRLNIAVPRANVIITNPTHYAVALRYDDKTDKAPKVIAKGKDFVAQQIRMIATANAVTIYESPALARAIFHTTKLGHEVHPGLYMAIAIVLSYVHQLKRYQHGLGDLPQIVSDLQIPKEFIYDK